MGLADLRPLPIPLLVRYKLIDSCSLAAAGTRRWYATATIAAREQLKNERRRDGKHEERKGEEPKWRRRKAVLYRALPRRNETEFMPPVVAPTRPSCLPYARPHRARVAAERIDPLRFVLRAACLRFLAAGDRADRDTRENPSRRVRGRNKVDAFIRNVTTITFD